MEYKKVSLEKIRGLRLARNLTQVQMANLLGVCEKTYSNMENGKSAISANQFFKLEDIFEVPQAELLEIPENSIQNQEQQNNIHHHHYYGEDTLPMQINQLQQEKEQMQARYETLEALIEQLKSENTHLKELMDSMNKDNGD